MRKLLILVLAVLLISGCGKDKGAIPDPNKIIYSGSEGVTLEFALNSPPDRVTEGQHFPILLKLTNNGAVDVGDVGDNKNKYFVVISAETPKFHTAGYGPISGEAIGKLDGKITNLVGGLRTYDATPMEYAEINDKPTQNSQEILPSGVITASICYGYQTKFSGGVCIDTNPNTISTIEKACEMKSLEFKDQGAPIAVTKIEPSVVTKEDGKNVAQFKIFFENLGKGLTVDPDRVGDACSRSVTGPAAQGLYGVVNIFATLGEDELICDIPNNSSTGKRIISDTATENFFVCQDQNPVGALGSFTTDLSATLTYGYTESISKIIQIEGQVK